MTYQEMIDAIQQQYPDHTLFERLAADGEYHQINAYGEVWQFRPIGGSVCMNAPSTASHEDRATTTLTPTETLAAFNECMETRQRWDAEEAASYATAAHVDLPDDWLEMTTASAGETY